MYSTWPRNCVEECFQLPRMGPGVLQQALPTLSTGPGNCAEGYFQLPRTGPEVLPQALPMLSTGPGDDTKRFSRCARMGPEIGRILSIASDGPRSPAAGIADALDWARR